MATGESYDREPKKRPARLPGFSLIPRYLAELPNHVVQAGTRTAGRRPGPENQVGRKEGSRFSLRWPARCHETSKKGRDHGRKPAALRSGR